MENFRKKCKKFCLPIIKNVKNISYDRKNNLIKLILLLIAELFCFEVTRIGIFSFKSDKIYILGMNFIQILYFLPFFLISMSLFIRTKSDKSLLINSTIMLILYAIILHIFIVPIVSFFTNVQGTINFAEYTSKIYFICLPFVGFSIFLIKKENMLKTYFLLIFRIILLFIITIILKNLFALKGVLYAWPLSEIVYVLMLVITYKKAGI